MNSIKSLVISDNVKLRETLLSQLREWQISAACCTKCADIASQIRDFQPHLLVIDKVLYKRMALSINNVGAFAVKNTMGTILMSESGDNEPVLAIGNFVDLTVPYTKTQLFSSVLQALSLQDHEPIWSSRIYPLEEINAKFVKLFKQIDDLKKMAETPIISLSAEKSAVFESVCG